jgi:hypothetical protein
MPRFGAQMIQICHPPEPLQHAQALEHWAGCRERAVARLERKVERLLDQKRVGQAARLRCAARYLRHAALRERLHAAALREAAQP